MEAPPIEQNSLLFSPSESLLSAQQQQHQHPLTIHIAQQTRMIYIIKYRLSPAFTLVSLANSHMGDMCSPNHALDSPMSDDYSTASTGVLDTNSLSGIGSADMLTANYKGKEIYSMSTSTISID